MIGSTAARRGALFAAAFAGALLSAALPAGAMSYSVIYSFQGGTTDGAAPYSTLLDLGGTFYGTTLNGGSGSACGISGCGTWYSVTTAGAEDLLYSFKGGNDGANPYGGTIDASGMIYGTTRIGGGSGCGGAGCGTVYTITTGGPETPFYSFKGGSDGANPYRTPLAVGTTLYGTTYAGGSACGGAGCGTVYSLNATTGHENWVYSFKCGSGDGEGSTSHLVKVGALLYGTTTAGGCGIVFSISTRGVEKVVYAFQGSDDGSEPGTGLINVAGTLYGTTGFGGGTGCGGAGCGTVFSLTTGGTLNWVYDFKGGKDGMQPGIGGLLNKGGTLYGTTIMGGGTGCGGSGCGTVFSITTAGQGEKVVHAFKGGSDGLYPQGSLNNANGTLYGTTSYGGGTNCSGCGCGTVFKLKP